MLADAGTTDHYIAIMCGRVIQSSAPIRYAIVDGMDVCDSPVHNYPPRWNGAPSQDLLVIRRIRRNALRLRCVPSATMVSLCPCLPKMVTAVGADHELAVAFDNAVAGMALRILCLLQR